jgi:hypothetical protein
MLQVTAISPDEMERGFVLASMYRLRVLLGSAAALSVAGVGGTVAHALIRQYGLYLISSYVPSPLKPAPHHAFLYTFPLVLLAVAFLSKTVVGIILMVRAYLLSGGEAKALAGVWVLVTFLTLAGLAILIRVALEPAIGVPYYDVLPARLGPMSITAGYGIMIISGTAGLWAVKLA